MVGARWARGARGVSGASGLVGKEVRGGAGWWEERAVGRDLRSGDGVGGIGAGFVAGAQGRC